MPRVWEMNSGQRRATHTSLPMCEFMALSPPSRTLEIIFSLFPSVLHSIFPMVRMDPPEKQSRTAFSWWKLLVVPPSWVQIPWPYIKRPHSLCSHFLLVKRIWLLFTCQCPHIHPRPVLLLTTFSPQTVSLRKKTFYFAVLKTESENSYMIAPSYIAKPLFISLKKNFFFQMCMGILPTRMSMYYMYVYLVPLEATKWYWVPWYRSYRCLWAPCGCWESTLGSL